MFALAASRAFSEWGWTKEDLGNVAVKNHKNGASHPKAHFRRPITLADAVNAPMISWPLGRFDCCAVSDGSAAVVITRPEIAKDTKHKDDYVVVKANALAIESLQPMYKVSYNWLGFPATRDAARAAYAEAGITDPLREIDFVELHDAYTSSEIQTYEDLALCKYGEGGKFVEEGHPFMPQIDYGLKLKTKGTIPVNPSGGLIACGHPVGATGLMQAVFAFWQIQGTIKKHYGSPELQLKKANRGLIHSHAGTGTYVTVSIMERGW
jgi:acetyl-CoA C-acetyltransferase